MRALLSCLLAFLAGAVIAAAAAPARAQGSTWSMSDRYSATSPSAEFQTPTYTPTPHSAIEHHASTYFEGAGRAISAIMKAYADGTMSLAQARILMAEAHAREMQNEVIRTETFLARRNALTEDFRQRTQRHWEWLEIAREHRAERERSVLLEAYHLPPSRLNRLTGAISWPDALMAPELTTLREDVQAVMTQLASHGPAYTKANGMSVAAAVEDLRDAFRCQRALQCVELSEYFECQSFLVGLKYHAQHWGQSGDMLAMVASR